MPHALVTVTLENFRNADDQKAHWPADPQRFSFVFGLFAFMVEIGAIGKIKQPPQDHNYDG